MADHGSQKSARSFTYKHTFTAGDALSDETSPTKPVTTTLDAKALKAPMHAFFDAGGTQSLAWRTAQLRALLALVNAHADELTDRTSTVQSCSAHARLCTQRAAAL